MEPREGTDNAKDGYDQEKEMTSATKKPRKRRYLTHEQLNAMPLHKLLAVGLRDLRKQERTPGCKVEMGEWLSGDGRKCTACVAGSVLRHEMRSPFSEWDELRLLPAWMAALDSLRVGRVASALDDLDRDREPGTPFWRIIPDYHTDRTGWWKAMRRLHADLKKAGL